MSTIKPLSAAAPSAGAAVEADLAVTPGRTAEVTATTAPDAMREALSAARAGQLSGADAIARLAAEAAMRSGAPPSARAAVEARLQELLRADPTLGALLAKAGVDG